MTDYGKDERRAFLEPPRSRAVWVFVAAAFFVNAEYWLRRLYDI